MVAKSNFAYKSTSDDEVQEARIVIVLLDYQIGSTLLTNFYRTIPKFKLSSNIIINNEISNELIYHTKHNSKIIPSPPQLLYRGSRDGFEADDFHSRCDNQGPTLTIIKSESSNEPTNQIFGGFTTQSWKLNGWISDDSAFIFKIDNENSSNQQLLRKFNIKQERKQYAINYYKHHLSTFGKGHDICIASNCNLNNSSYSNFGFTFELPLNDNGDEYRYKSEKAKSYLAGSYKFKVSEIEVFKITINQ